MDDVLAALGDEYSATILGEADDAMSAQELSDELDIPIATAYRRIEDLTQTGLLEHTDRVLSEDRRRVNVYRRDVSKVTVAFGDDALSVDVEGRNAVKNKLDDVWRAMSDS